MLFDNVSPAESEPAGVVSSGWLWAARCSALICTIALGVGFVAEATAHDPAVALFSFGPWGSLSLALLYLLFRSGKNPPAFALGMGAATAFIALLAVSRGGLSRTSEVLRHVFFILGMLILVLPPFALTGGQSTLGALLGWLFSLSSAMLGLSSIVAFQKMMREAKGMGKLRFAFGAGIYRRVSHLSLMGIRASQPHPTLRKLSEGGGDLADALSQLLVSQSVGQFHLRP